MPGTRHRPEIAWGVAGASPADTDRRDNISGFSAAMAGIGAPVLVGNRTYSANIGYSVSMATTRSINGTRSCHGHSAERSQRHRSHASICQVDGVGPPEHKLG